jgi:hypothetical protein
MEHDRARLHVQTLEITHAYLNIFRYVHRSTSFNRFDDQGGDMLFSSLIPNGCQVTFRH